jgi:hypothetical protein
MIMEKELGFIETVLKYQNTPDLFEKLCHTKRHANYTDPHTGKIKIIKINGACSTFREDEENIICPYCGRELSSKEGTHSTVIKDNFGRGYLICSVCRAKEKRTQSDSIKGILDA